MKKSVRINLLVITIVVTLFAFAGLWYLRPGVPNEILAQAKLRQTQPLMEVTPPLRKPVVEQVADTSALEAQLLPKLKEQLEPTLTDAIKTQLLSDQTLVASLASSLQPLLLDQLKQQWQSTAAGIQKSLEASTVSSLESYVNTQVQALRSEGLAYGSSLTQTMNTTISDAKASIEAYIPQIVDGMIPMVVKQVVAQLEANKDSYLAYFAEKLPKGLGEADLLALYESYRNQIIKDLVPSLLDGMEGTVRSQVDAYVAKMPLVRVPAAPAVPSVNVKAVEQPMPALETVAQPVAVEPVPTVEPVAVPAVEPTATVAPTPVVTQPVVSVEQAPSQPVLKEGLEPITLPVFEEKPQVVYLDPVVYEQQRQDIRTKAIDEVLKRLAP